MPELTEKVALATFPRSGNSWLRLLLEKWACYYFISMIYLHKCLKRFFSKKIHLCVYLCVCVFSYADLQVFEQVPYTRIIFSRPVVLPKIVWREYWSLKHIRLVSHWNERKYYVRVQFTWSEIPWAPFFLCNVKITKKKKKKKKTKEGISFFCSIV